MKRDKPQITLRLPPDLDKKISEASTRIGVSKNAYILMLLSQVEKNAS